MAHLGISPRDFTLLPFDNMKQIAMAKLPTALTPITDNQTILKILNALRETSRSDLAHFLTTESFQQYLNAHPTVETTRQAHVTQYTYRLRLNPQRGKQRNDLWTSPPGAILSHWLQAAVTLFPTHSLSVALSPHHPDKQQLPIIAQHSIPSIQTLELYCSEVTRDKSNYVVQLDFWILTPCPDLEVILPRKFDDSLGTEQKKYIRDLSRSHMRFSTQEQIPIDMEKCAVCVGSISHDANNRILMELKERIPKLDPWSGHIHISWMKLRTNWDRASALGKVIFAPSREAPTIRDILSQHHPSSESHLVTRTYDLIMLPDQTHPTYAATIAHAITKQTTFLETTTSVSFGNLARINPFTTVPPLTLMAHSDTTQANSESVASLILNGQIQRNDTTLSSPVTKVAMDITSTRLFLYAPKSSAVALINFAEHLFDLLPTWTQQLKPITKDCIEACRTLQATTYLTPITTIPTPTIQAQSQTRQPAPTDPPTIVPYATAAKAPPPYFAPPPSLAPATMPSQYQAIIDQLTSFSSRLESQDEKLAKILQAQDAKFTEILQTLTQRTFPECAEWIESIVSPITSTLNSQADSIRTHQLTTTSMQQSQLMLPLETHTQALSTLTTLTQRQHDTNTSAHATFLTTSDQTKALLTTAAADISYLRSYVDRAPQSNIPTANPTTTLAPPPNHDDDHTQSNPPSPINELDVEYPDGLTRPRGDCTLCHEYTEDLKICDTCELPFDDQCILLIRHRDTNHEEYQCNSCHGKTKPSMTYEGLTELSEDEKSNPTTTTLTTTELTHPESCNTTPYDTIQKPIKQLRPLAGKTPRFKPTRTTPPKTRHSTSALGNIPPAPDEQI